MLVFMHTYNVEEALSTIDKRYWNTTPLLTSKQLKLIEESLPSNKQVINTLFIDDNSFYVVFRAKDPVYQEYQLDHRIFKVWKEKDCTVRRIYGEEFESDTQSQIVGTLPSEFATLREWNITPEGKICVTGLNFKGKPIFGYTV